MAFKLKGGNDVTVWTELFGISCCFFLDSTELSTRFFCFSKVVPVLESGLWPACVACCACDEVLLRK